MISIENINLRHIIDNIYIHIDKICTQNKTTLPPRDPETIEKIQRILITNVDDLNHEVLNMTKKNIYGEWKKDQKGFLYIHKGFHTAFKFALEQSIPRTLDQIWQETPGLSQHNFDLLETTNKQHFRLFKDDMLFQRGTAEYMHNYSVYIPEDEYLFRSNSALAHSKKTGIPELERWNFLTGAIWQYINSKQINTTKRKYESLTKYSFEKKAQPRMNTMETLDYYSDN